MDPQEFAVHILKTPELLIAAAFIWIWNGCFNFFMDSVDCAALVWPMSLCLLSLQLLLLIYSVNMLVRFSIFSLCWAVYSSTFTANKHKQETLCTMQCRPVMCWPLRKYVNHKGCRRRPPQVIESHECFRWLVVCCCWSVTRCIVFGCTLCICWRHVFVMHWILVTSCF